MSERKQFLLQSRIEDAILEFFSIAGSPIPEDTRIEFNGIFDAYDLAVAIERVVDEGDGDLP